MIPSAQELRKLAKDLRYYPPKGGFHSAHHAADAIDAIAEALESEDDNYPRSNIFLQDPEDPLTAVVYARDYRSLQLKLAAAEANHIEWMNLHNSEVAKAHRARLKAEDECAALRRAIDAARRETASDTDNRWCRNATIILNDAARGKL